MNRDLDDVLRDLKRGLTDLANATPTYVDAEAYYRGDDPELFISDVLRRHLRDEIAAFRLNLAAVPVDSVMDRLFIASFVSQDADTQAEIARILAENEVWSWSNDAMRDGEMYGDEYVGVWVGADERPVLSPLDPLTTRVVYDVELERIPEYLVRIWKEKDEDGDYERATISYPDEIYKFWRKDNSALWEPYDVDDEAWPLVNELNELPAGHLRNGMPYGEPGHIKSWGMQQMITKALLNMAANIDFMGFNQRYALKHADKLENTNLPVPAPRTRDGEPVSGTVTSSRPALTTGPGKLWNLRADAVGEFKPTEVTQFLALMDWCILSMARAERLPVRLFSDPSGQESSGDSQRESDRPLRNRVEARKRSMAAGWVSIIRKALRVVDPNRAWGSITVEWAQDEITTDQAAYDAANAAADLVAKAIEKPELRPFVIRALQGFGYSKDEATQFVTGTLGNSAGTNSPNMSIDSSDVEG